MPAGGRLVIFGIVIIYMDVNGRSTVNDQLSQQKITGTPDMTPQAIAAEAKQAGLSGVAFPACFVANQPIDDGTKAKCFAEYMRIHALEATGGKVCAEMPRYADRGRHRHERRQCGAEVAQRPTDEITQRGTSGRRETALSRALDVGYMAEQLCLFSIVTGVALLLLAGIGSIVLALTGSALPVECSAAAQALTNPRPAGDRCESTAGALARERMRVL